MKDETRMTRTVTPTQMTRLADWSMRKPVVALMGEFSSGKSSLMNLLLRQNVLPMQVTATRLPPIWLRYGDAAPYRVDHEGRRHPVDWQDPSSIPLKETRFVRLYHKAEILKRCDLIDTPGISDPSIPVRYWINAVAYANAVLWCTHSGQAWRESERAAWLDLPRRLRDVSVLLVTRKDKLKTVDDLRKIQRRLRRETEGLFNARAFVSLTHALAASQSGDQSAWDESGAQDLVEKFNILVDGVTLQRCYMLERYEIGDEAPRAATESRTPPKPVLDEERYFVLRNAISIPGQKAVAKPMRSEGRNATRASTRGVPVQRIAAPIDIVSRL
ncbi:MAG: dynamin family protein [Albidovulum sp.]|uniref:dynamin family protein n=1 Tax=Albidovulum sp. TaxID=1872424 RepID=UPI003CA2FAC0